MDYRQLVEYIQARFDAQVAVPLSLKVELPNGPRIAPEPEGTESWARLSIRLVDSELTETGRKTSRAAGVFFVQIFSPAGNGEGAALDIADLVVANFKGVTVNEIMYLSPTPRTVGRDAESGEWWQINVECPFRATLRET